MRPLILLAALSAIGAIALPSADASAQRRASAQRDWTATVVQTAEGGYRMGNPNATTKIVEFVSLTCPHCRHFSQEGMPQLMPHIRSGRVSLELRNFVLNPLDLAAAMISRCAAPARYFGFTGMVLAEQPNWVARVDNMGDLHATTAAEALQALSRIVTGAGLDRMAARHGVSAAQARACLADEARLARLMQMRQDASALGVTGTPSFMVNGTLAAGVNNWAGLAPLVSQGR